MKRLLLLFASCALAIGAQAQLAPTSAVRLDQAPVADGLEGRAEPVTVSPEAMKAYAAAKAQTGTANKGTLAGSRWYNYVDHVAILKSSVYNNGQFPYMWNKPDMYGVYSSTTGLIRDTIPLNSYGFVFHPFWGEYNDPNAY